jgi:hypothetical protein
MRIRAEPGLLQPGARVEIQVGARSKNGEKGRVGGIWVPCEVVSDSGKEVVVKLLG